MNKHLIFIYGSLRRGSVASMSIRFPHSQFVTEAKVNGRLYDLGDFPGLLLDESASTVVGEVYEVDGVILKDLDDFERSSNYVRKQVEASLGEDKKMCWTYEPNPEFYSLSTLIKSGDWIEYLNDRVVS